MFNEDYQLYSFDVFDTLIARKTAVPKGIFDLIEYDIRENKLNNVLRCGLLQSYASLRIQAERLARSKKCNNGIEDVTLKQIYEVFTHLTQINSREAEFLHQYELLSESKNIIGLESNIKILKNTIAKNKKVILISDMYMSSDELRGILVQVDEIFENIPIYTSSDYKMMKSTGSLFRYIRKIEGVDYCHWHHMGDNVKSDYEIPSSLGICCRYAPYADLWNIEKEFLNVNYKSVYVQYAIGVARYLRWSNEEKSYPFIFGCTIAGFLVFSYVIWLIRRCQELNIKRLYFIARDGYLPYMITSNLIDKQEIDIEARYIYGSRYAWRMAAFDGKSESLRKILVLYFPTTIREMASCLQISEFELKQYLPVSLINKSEFTLDDFHFCLSTLCANRSFLQFLSLKNKEKKELAYAYLMHEVDISDNAYAFVEIQGTGYTQECLAKIIQKMVHLPILTFAFYMGNIADKNLCKFENFFSNKCELHIEALFQSTHGSTIGYTKAGENIIPLLENELKNEDYVKYIDGVKSFCALYEKWNGLDMTILPKTTELWKNLIVRDFDYTRLSFCRDIPYDPVKKYLEKYDFARSKLAGCSVILYGAGKYGRILYDKIMASDDICLIAWIDKNYSKIDNPLVVGDIEYIRDLSFDKFLIGISDIDGSVHSEIIDYGIPEDKIVDLY